MRSTASPRWNCATTNERALRTLRVTETALSDKARGQFDGSEIWRAVLEDFRGAWNERVAIRAADGGLPRSEAERLAWAGSQP